MDTFINANTGDYKEVQTAGNTQEQNGQIRKVKEQLLIQNIPHHLSNKVEAVLWMDMCGCQWNWITEVNVTDGSCRMNSEV